MEKKHSQPSKTILFIGNQKYKAIVKSSSTTVSTFIQKRLHTSFPEKWEETLRIIRDLNNTGCLKAVFIDLSLDLALLITLDEYAKLWKDIFQEISKTRCIVMINESIYDGIKEDHFWYGESSFRCHEKVFEKYITKNTIHWMFELKNLMKERTPNINQVLLDVIGSGVEIEVCSWRNNSAEIIKSILDTIDPEIAIRLYVPKGNYQERLIADFLDLFEDYLRNIHKISFLIDHIKSEHGTMYIFKCNDGMTHETLDRSFEQFRSFLDLTQNDIHTAREILLKANIGSRDAEQLLTKYTRQYNRIQLDIRHEYEGRTLALKHRLENEVFDNIDGIPLCLDQSNVQKSLLLPSENFGEININLFSNQVFDNSVVQNSYEEIFYGDIKYGMEDKAILDLIQKYENSRLEALSLKSELDILKDKSLPQDNRQSAKQKIEKFLSKVGPKIGEKAFEILVEYIKRAYLP